MAFSFGSTSTSNANKPALSFGGFGASNTSSTTGTTPSNPFALNSSASSTQAKPTFSFGTPSTAPAAGTGSSGFSFGAPNTNNQQSTGASGTTTQSNPFGGFGASTTSTGNTGTSTLFGSKPAGASGFGGFGGFGQSTTNNASNTTTQPFAGFGQSQQQQQQQQQPLSLSSLTASTQPPNFQEAYRPPPASIEDRVKSIQNAWDPNSPSCRFSFFFYNASSNPITVPLSELPPPAHVANSPLRLQGYKQAVNENPHPEKYVPVLASSIDDLQKRVNIQKQTTDAHLKTLKSKEIQGKIQEGNKKHWSETSVRVEKLNRQQVRLEERLVRFCARLAGLQMNTSSASSSSESDLLVTLERIRNELSGAPTNRQQSGSRQAGNGGARLAGIVNELWMVVSQRKALLVGPRSGTPDGGSSAEWGIVDESEMQKVLEVLAQQQKSLDYLSKQIRLHLLDIDTCRIGFGLPLLSNQQEQKQDRAAIMTN